MGKTLNLIDILLTTGRHLFLMGRFTEALDPLTKLCGFRKLPRHVSEEIQALLGEIALQQKRYEAARRHLTAAISHAPLKAEYSYLMALAIEEDDAHDLKRAESHYARAVKLDAEEPTYCLDFGAYLFKIGKAKEGLNQVRKAYTLGITDPEVVARVAAVLTAEGHGDEATTKVRAALFHNHGSAGFRQVWQQHQFARIHASQQKAAVEVSREELPVILPFVPAPATEKYVALGGKTIRIDQAEALDSPKKKEASPFRRPPKKG